MRRTTAVVTASLVAASVLGIALRSGAATPGTSRSWIDAPLDGTVVTKAAVEVTAHATDPSGVTAARLTVNGTDAGETDLGGETLHTVAFSWTAPGSGLYTFEVAARNADGEWGASAAVDVLVNLGDLVDTTTTTDASTTTTVPTTTTIPPTTTTICALGVPVPGSVTGTVLLTPTVHWSYSGCREPEEFEIEVSRDPGFLRNEWLGYAGGEERQVTISVGTYCATYYWRIRTHDLGDEGPWSPVNSFFVGNRC
ncbi:MAG: hypothetical protein R2823_02910 [Acidimicrobiia bacterium]